MTKRTNLALVLFAWLFAFPISARVVDNFDDDAKTGWTDFTFVPGVGLPVEQNGQFKFDLPGAVLAQVKSGLFSASQKTSENFELKEGRTVEFRVDLVKGGGKDSFAVLGFLPTANSPSTLAGYSLSKSTTDVLITKGINKYFVADAGAAADLKNENVTLVLSLTVKGGSVIIHGQVLDKDSNNAVIWDKTVVDTPAADVLVSGTDSPAAPYITTGYFTLFCYADYDANAPEDPYTVTYDNAEVYVTDSIVLDDFNDNVKTAWTDFSFVPGVGLPVEQEGQFKFEIPGAVLMQAKSGLFTASQKTSREFALVEGERLELSVDLVKGGAKDSFAVLGFLPTGNSPSTLSGYSLAKSTTDVLITKGVNKYFVADAGAAANLKNENVTLVLSLTAKSGNVIITGRVLDKDAANAVIWEKTVIDTPAADVLVSGTDSPAAPFITSGYFTLFCYADYDANAVEDPYTVTYDNAAVSSPPVATNVPPIISGVQPSEFSNFLPVSAPISFQASDDHPLGTNFSIILNGTLYTPTNGLIISGVATNKTATLNGLSSNVNYTAIFSVQDADGATATRTIYFDTFSTNNFVIEAEDYNFDGGSFIDNPLLIAEGAGPQSDAYSLQTGVQNIDFSDTRTTPRAQDALYRPNDSVRMNHTLDNLRAKFVAAGGGDAGVYDYDLQDIAAGEWLNYTRTFPAGSYEVYVREAVANMASGESVLELVTGNPKQENQSTRVLGSFLGVRTGFQYRNFPLTDGSGANKVILRLSGPTTLRLRQVTSDPSDGERHENYLIFIPVADPGVQRAAITSISPAPNSTTDTLTPVIRVEIQNRDTSVQPGTIRLTVNREVVAPALTNDTNGTVVTYPLSTLPSSGATNTASISFKDNLNVDVSSDWAFVVTYRSLDPSNRLSGAGKDPGFNFRIVQAPQGSALANSLQRAEDQLAANSTIPKVLDTNFVVQAVNFNKTEGDAGEIPGDQLVPGLEPDINGTEDFAVETEAYLDLSAGVHRFGVISDDGFKLTTGSSLMDTASIPLDFHNGGPANQTVDFLVPVAGLYPFRLVWYERGGSGYAEWFSVDMQTGVKTLINDSAAENAVKAYTTVSNTTPVLKVEVATVVNGPYVADPTAIIDSNAKTVTISVAPSGTHFYRLNGSSVQTISKARISGNSFSFNY